MTPERKQAEEITPDEVLEKVLREWQMPFTCGGEKIYLRVEIKGRMAIIKAMEEFAALRVAEATKDMYPKAFVEWIGDEELYFDMKGGTWLLPDKNSSEGDFYRKTTEELFEYWKQNISK